MIGKPGSPALLGMAVLCALVLGACGNGPSLHFVAVTPASGTVYFGRALAGGVKGALAPATRKGAVVASPQDITNAACRSQQFTATAFFSDGSSMDETNAVTWTSSNTSVADIGPNGNAFGFALGTVKIGAIFNGTIASPASLEVDQLNSITMSPLSANIPSGGSQQFVANGNFTLAGGASAQQPIVATQLTWSVLPANTNLVKVDVNGNATSTGNGTGQVTIVATTCDGLAGMANVTVGAPQLKLLVTPSNPAPAIATGSTLQFTAVHSDMSAVGTLTWTSSNTGEATINANTGLALGVSPSATANDITITATESGTGLVGTTTLTVSAAAARYAYVGNLDRGDISSYTVSAGALAPNNGANGQNPYPFPANANPAQVLIHPSGDFLYYLNDACFLTSAFVASTTGVITANTSTQITNPTSTAAVFPCLGVMDPLGRFLYVVGSGNSGIYGFQITQSSAQATANQTVAGLTAIAPVAPYTDGNFPDWIMIDRTGQFLYVVNTGFNGNVTPSVQGQGSISEYSITQSGASAGALTLLGTINVGNGTTNGPFFGTIDRHNNLFVANLGTGANDETVAAFSIGANGQLTLLGDTPITGALGTAVGTTNVITSPVADNLYVLDAGGAQVFAFSYTISDTPAAITLSPISGGASQPTGSNANGMAIDPTGTLLLIDDAGLNAGASSVPGSVFVYTVGANGGLPNAAANVTADVGAQFVQFYTALPGQ